MAAAVMLGVSSTGCETVQQQLGRIGDAGYVMSCATGAVAGGLVGAVVSGTGDKGKLLAAAAAGCAIGLAATAVGKMLNARQREKHEESVQRTAKRQAKELEAYSQTERRYEQMPVPASDTEQAAREQRRDEELAQIRRRYEEPDTQDLGEGASSTVTPVFPAGVGESDQLTCFDQNVMVETPTGRATQVQTMCRKKGTDEYVRAEVREGAA
ncbi:MAG: hypothetical protein IT532_13715 [Burkholderiales bacterium]|nr:hypothetical protein [Burkholderiales bacterium]